MRVKKQGHKNPIPVGHCNFFIYDETKEVDRVKEKLLFYPVPEGVDADQFRETFAKNLEISYKVSYGNAYKHPFLCEFTVYKDKPIAFAFDNELKYSSEDLKKIVKLAKAAERRCKWLTTADLVL